MMREYFIQATYLVASVLFILGLRSLTKPDKARRGMQLAAVGMLLAVVGTLLQHEIVRYEWIIGGPRCSARSSAYPLGMFGADDGDAAADRASRTCSARWRRRWSASPSTRMHGTDASASAADGGAGLRGAVRLAHHHRQLHGLRQAAGASSPAQPITYKGQNAVEHRAVRGRRSCCFVYLIVDPGPSPPCLLRDDRARACCRRAAGAADRRRRHAGRHLAAQLLRRPGRRGDRLRARQQRADHRRRARRRRRASCCRS